MEYSGIINPLDLKTIFVDYLAGSTEIFVLIGVLLLGFIGHYFKMKTPVFLTLSAIFIVITSYYTRSLFIMTSSIILLILGIVIARLIEK